MNGTVLAQFVHWQNKCQKINTLNTTTQMLCQTFNTSSARPRLSTVFTPWLLGIFLLLLGCNGFAQAQTTQEKMLAQASQWVTKNLQLSEKQFSFAPLDARVRVLACDKPLAMDLPFASRETVRVRCQADQPWQLYLRVIPASGDALASPSQVLDGKEAGPRRVVVGTQLLRRGTVLSPDMLKEIDYAGPGLDSQALSSIKDLENGEMVRDMSAGTPLRSYDVRRAVLVKQGQSVLLTVTQGNGFAITARLEALQDGKMGDQIRLKNPESGRLLTGIVTGPNAVKSQ
jgi:flagella basal body P-ring formation protein FlgA